MTVQLRNVLTVILVATGSIAAAGCGVDSTTVKAEAKPEPLTIEVASVESRPIDRYLRVTGSLVADEQAEVSAEAPGRVIATPVERGTRVSQGAVLARISATETSAQLLEAEANAAQIEARLGLGTAQTFDPKRVPDVMNAKAALDLAEAEFGRIRSLLDQRWSRKASTTSAARKLTRRGSSSRWLRTSPDNRIARSKPREPESRSRARRRPTLPSAPPSPASSRSVSSASAITLLVGNALRRWYAWIPCEWS